MHNGMGHCSRDIRSCDSRACTENGKKHNAHESASCQRAVSRELDAVEMHMSLLVVQSE